jgi:cobalamin biosynthesis Mg chelatase CobN
VFQKKRCANTLRLIQGQYTEGLDLDLASHHHTVTPCSDGSYCCGNGTLADACCEEKKGLFVMNGTAGSQKPVLDSDVIRTTSASTDRKPSSSATSSTASLASLTLSKSLGVAATTAQISSSEGLSTSISTAKSSDKTGVITGGTIGGVAVLVLIIGTILLLRRRNIRDVQDHQSSMITSNKEKSHSLHEVSGDDGSNELDGNMSIPELQNPRSHYEMQ